MRFKATLVGLACAVSALGVAACSSSGTTASSGSSTSGGSSSSAAPCATGTTTSSSSGGSSSGGSTTTLTMEQSPAASVPDIMNPFAPTSADNTLGFTEMIYEPLLQFDDLKPGTSYPWLATKYAWSNSGRTITFTIRSGVKFTDGEAFDAQMAAWEFNWLKTNPTANTNALPITTATAPNATTLVINFSDPEYTNLYNIGNTLMVPQKIWSAVKGDPSKFTDTDPVGTGPYTLKNFSAQGVTLTASPSYWQGKSHVPNLDFPTYSSNTSANQALEDGQLDWAGNFVQNIQTSFLDKSSNNHCWDVGLQTETLIPNLNAFPFNGSDGQTVREAISDGVDRQQISSVGEDGQQPPAQGTGSLTGLTLPLDQQYVTSSVSQYTATYDPSKAKSLLKADGWTMGSDGYFQKAGKTLEFTVEDPAEYTDFITDDNIMQAQLKKVGIKVDIKADTVDSWDADLADGNFNSMMHWGNGGISPYNMYDNWLDTTLDTGANAKDATGDYEHFSGADANQAEKDLLNYAAAAPTTTGAPTTQQIQDVDALGTIIAKDLPVIPLFYGVAWDDFNDSNWTGWPTPSNEYEPAQPNGPMNEVTILHLRPKS
jgi:peptide/nickel transport system substrate-binding protein